MLKPVDLSGGKSVLRSVLNIFFSIYQENKLNWGIFFINVKKVQVCQCNMGNFEGNSFVRKIVISSRELNQIWGGGGLLLFWTSYSSMGVETSRFELGKVSI